MVDLNPTISLITLTINGLKKTLQLKKAEINSIYFKKQELTICSLKMTNFTYKGKDRWNEMGGRRDKDIPCKQYA